MDARTPEPFRLRIRLGADVLALLGEEKALALVGTEVSFTSSGESASSRIEKVEISGGYLEVTLVIDELMPPGVAMMISRDGSAGMSPG